MKSRSIDKSYGRKVGALTVVTVLSKVIGALYRVPLTNIIGAEGVGVYQLIFSIYALAIAATSAFHSTLIARQIASFRATGEDASARGYFLTAFAESAVSSLLVATILFSFGERIALLQGAAGGGLGYAVIAPAVVFVAFLSCLKGWFNGHMDLTPTALSLLLEQGVKLAAGLTLAWALRDRGAVVAAAAALGGVTISEAVSVAVLAVLYFAKGGLGERRAVSLGRVWREGFPLRMNGVIMPLAAFADSLIVVRLLGRFGMERGDAISVFGIYSGAVQSVLNFPVVIVLSIAVAVIPVIAASKATRDIVSLKEKSDLTVKITLVVSLPCAVAVAVLAPKIVGILYPVFSPAETALATSFMRICAANVVFLALTQIYASLLQAVDRAEVAAEALAVSVLVRVLLMFITVPRLGATGIAISTLASYALATILDLVKWLQYTGRAKNALKTLASVALSCSIMIAVIAAPAFLMRNEILSIALSAAVGSVVYIVTVLKLRVFTPSELMCMPLSSITTKIGR